MTGLAVAKRWQLRVVLNGGILAAGLLSATVAQADNEDSYNGSQCSGVFGTGSEGLIRSEYGLANSTGDNIWVTCPVQRVSVDGMNAIELSFTASPGTICYLRVMNQNGIIVSQANATATDGSLTEIQLAGGGAVSLARTDTVALTCGVPGEGFLLGYQYSEQGSVE